MTREDKLSIFYLYYFIIVCILDTPAKDVLDECRQSDLDLLYQL